MADPLEAARTLAETIRFSGDTLNRTDGSPVETHALGEVLLRNELEIAAEVTPDLYSGLKLVCERLNIPRSRVRAFVYASPALDAQCFASGTSVCVVRFSSGLVDLLDQDEFAFVCGHELGHFLLGHGVARVEAREVSLEYFIQRRAQEISVDRVGLVACESLDVAIRALMKTVSGLTDRHLRFDVGRFVAQLRDSTAVSSLHEGSASHPSVLVRCRALLWFSLNDAFRASFGSVSREQMAQLDQRIESDLDRYVDGPLRARIRKAKDEVSMWMAVREIIDRGAFTRTDQSSFEDMFGAETLEGLKAFLVDIPRAQVQDAIRAKVEQSRDRLEALIPSSFASEVSELQEGITSRFS